nr:hypothetical protein GCM10025699_35030 [Microbacterium flavescens]
MQRARADPAPEAPSERDRDLGAALRVPVRGDPAVPRPGGRGLADVVPQCREHEQLARVGRGIRSIGMLRGQVGRPQRMDEHVALGVPRRVLRSAGQGRVLGDLVDQLLVAEPLRRHARTAEHVAQPLTALAVGARCFAGHPSIAPGGGAGDNGRPLVWSARHRARREHCRSVVRGVESRA